MKKIRKNETRKLFQAGAEFLIVPCNLRPEFGILINADEKKILTAILTG